MKKPLFSMLGIVILMALVQADSLACTCFAPFPKITLRARVLRARSEARAVFTGQVLEITEVPETFSVVVKLRVGRVLKGSVPEELSIVTAISDGICGFRFEIGESYLVYAHGSDERSLGTSICQRTARLSNATNDLKILGSGKAVQKGKP